MKVADSVAFVTGANRGLGLSFIEELRDRGARKVYAGVRNVNSVSLAGVIPVEIDVTQPDSVRSAAQRCTDVTLLVNNAGIGEISTGALDPGFIDATRRMLDTNFDGIVRTSQLFAPAIVANGGGGIVNVLSDVTWYARDWNAAYAATKSAAWSYSNALRMALHDTAVQVLALHVGFMDTDMVRGFDVPKSAPAAVSATTLDALEAGQSEVLADDHARNARHGLSARPAYYLNPGHLGAL